MISKDTLIVGQYFPGEGFVYSLDPRGKMVSFLMMMIFLFFTKTFYGFIPVFVLLLILFILSKIPIKHVLKGLKPILILLVFTIFFHFFFTAGHVIFKFYFLKLTREGIIRGSFIGIRLILLILISSILTFTTTPIELTKGLEFLLLPLEKIGFPSGELVIMITIALRFIPVLMEEAEKIIKAQTSRGANFDEGNIFKRAKSLIPILVPLFVSAFKRAEDLAVAMEVRCFQPGKKRTYMRKLNWRFSDTVFLLISIFVSISPLIFGI